MIIAAMRKGEKTMREILFRGKRTDNGEWVEGYFCGKVNETIFSPATESAQIIDKDLYWHEVIPESVGQYTGLTDENGKKIFEGDIVIIRQDSNHSVYGECKGEVCYSGAGYLISGVSDALSLYAFRWRCKVIGNIHDNPELLTTR